MKLDKDALQSKLQTYLVLFKKYRVFIMIVTFLGMYGFLVVRINALTQADPAPVNNDQTAIKSLRIDKQSINKILELKDQNVEVKSLFEQARDNPFSD